MRLLSALPDVADSREHALPSRNTLSIANMHTFWRSKPHSKNGKRCRTSVASAWENKEHQGKEGLCRFEKRGSSNRNTPQVFPYQIGSFISSLLLSCHDLSHSAVDASPSLEIVLGVAS